MTKKIDGTTMLDRFKQHTKTPIFAVKVHNLVEGKDICAMTFEELLSIHGMGRKGALLCMEVACDLMGKK